MGLIVSLIAYSLLASGLALALGAVVEMRHAFFLWRSKRVAVKDIAGGGIVDVRGAVHAAENPLTAPLTGRACVTFTVIMERAQPKTGQTRDGDPDLITFVGAAPFAVDDGTGKVRVDLREHRVPVTGTDVVKQPLARLTQPLEKLLAARFGKPGGVWCMNRDITATEAVLLEGAEVSVVGRVRAGALQPLHVTTGRARVVAMQGVIRAVAALGASGVLLALYGWVR